LNLHLWSGSWSGRNSTTRSVRLKMYHFEASNGLFNLYSSISDALSSRISTPDNFIQRIR